MVNDYLNIVSKIKINNSSYNYIDLKKLSTIRPEIKNLPFSIKILLENVIRNYDGFSIKKKHVERIINWKKYQGKKDIPYSPSRVIMQDFTGVPAIVDLASMRDSISEKGKDPEIINPKVPTDLVIDHSVNVEYFGTNNSLQKNVEIEYQKNRERYELLKWAQQSFKNFRVVPPGMGICHQINLEYLADCVSKRDGYLFPDTLVGTDSHTPMVNGIGVLGWGVGGIEAEAAMLGQPIFMILPEVIGLKLYGKLNEGATSTDLVLSITEKLRSYGVVGKIVEVFGDGVNNLSVTDRATISNMSPEFGCTDTHWAIDHKTLEYLENSNRSQEIIDRVKKYSKANLLWNEDSNSIEYTDIIEFDISKVEPTISGPKKPQQKILLSNVKNKTENLILNDFNGKITTNNDVSDGFIALAAITSCTNTSNPDVMIGAGLIAKKAIKLGLKVKPWVKTSLAPGSKVVTKYLKKSNLLPYLENLGYNIVGYGCTTCIGNSGDMIKEIQEKVINNNLVVSSVLSGNRNFEARIHPNIKMNFLMSPMLVVAYSLIGKINFNLLTDSFGKDKNGNNIYLKDLWPSNKEIKDIISTVLNKNQFKNTYDSIFEGDEYWKSLKINKTSLLSWDKKSTYIKPVSYLNTINNKKDEIKAKILLYLGDSFTTDHISPAGKFLNTSPAGKYLIDKGIDEKEFNSYGSRRGNEEVMVRGTFANVRIKNKLVKTHGGWTIYHPENNEMSIYDASLKYKENNISTVVIAGKEYGSGSSRDWAAKGTKLLGIKAVLATSFERIHRSNLIGMGVLPIEIKNNNLKLSGKELVKFNIENLEVKKNINVFFDDLKVEGIVRIDSEIEIKYFKFGGIINYILEKYSNE